MGIVEVVESSDKFPSNLGHAQFYVRHGGQVSGRLRDAKLALASAARTSPLIAPSFRTARSVMLASRWGTLEGRLLAQLARPGSMAIDVGANVGQYSVVLARALRGQGTVLAFEPNPVALGELVTATRRKRVLALPYALSSAQGKASLHVPTDAGGLPQIQLGSLGLRSGDGGSLSYEVEMETLDSFLPIMQSPVSVIKVDVEGHELAVLQGAEAVLGHFCPPLVLEIEHRHQPEGQTAEGVIHWLEDRGYGVKAITHMGEIGWQEGLDRQATFDVGSAVPGEDYVNTFLCLARR